MRAPSRAYDIEMLKHPVDRSAPDNHGWCFGLPPGIAPEQWPLDPANGYPLVHGFTLLLPEDYRCHGPEIVALSLFGTPSDMNDGGPRRAGVETVFAAGAEEPEDPDLRELWNSERARHPRLFRMKDDIDCNWAVILLTEADYTAPLCAPPKLRSNRYRDRVKPPRWLAGGAAAAYDGDGTYVFIRELLGGMPDPDVAYNRAVRWAPRREDPNAGVPTCDSWHEDQTGYQQPFYWEGDEITEDAYRLHAWGEDHAPMHIGGTMRPIQNVPCFSPFHIGFEEYFGGYNFASDGNAQLDFKNMKLDWACG